MRPALLLLTHRIPFPPNKGDKVRSYHLMRYLSARYRVFLGTFVDHPDDWRYVGDLSQWCVDHHVVRLDPGRAQLRSLGALLTGRPLTLHYYQDRGLGDWVTATVAREGIRQAVVFCSAMAQYAVDLPNMSVVVDFVDVDSAKWRQYAERRAWPWSWVFRREARTLLAYERRVAERAAAVTCVTQAECALFTNAAPESAGRVHAVPNGVDAAYFSPERSYPDPYHAHEAVVFTGAMDYWPNVDAVGWFAREVLPLLRRQRPALQFYVVGMNPAAEVLALADLPGVQVTGTVPDVRPYLAHARVVVAPLRVARGIQNKILEAMAMARPVVASAECASPIGAMVGEELVAAGDAKDFAGRVADLLADPAWASRVGERARARVLEDYAWDAQLSRLDTYLEVPAETDRESTTSWPMVRTGHAA